MKTKLMRKAAEAKSALVSKEAANNSTEVVILILFAVIIVFAVGAAVKALLTDDTDGVVAKVGGKITGKVDSELPA